MQVTTQEAKHLSTKYKTVGLVPTMGALHEGHLALASKSASQDELTLVSIFVNPSQFAPSEDLLTYPSSLDHDISLLSSLNCYYLAPTIIDMYPLGFDLVNQIGTFVSLIGFPNVMESRARPHFFRGVSTIIVKLLSLIRPTRLYLGQKDAQQCTIISRVVADLLINVQVVIVPTVCESDGLAMSSRNRYLSAQERLIAPILFKALQLGKAMFGSPVDDILNKVTEFIKIQGKDQVEFEYVSLNDPVSLKDVVDQGKRGILSGAIRVGKTRIIDNVLLGFECHEWSTCTYYG